MSTKKIKKSHPVHNDGGRNTLNINEVSSQDKLILDIFPEKQTEGLKFPHTVAQVNPVPNIKTVEKLSETKEKSSGK